MHRLLSVVLTSEADVVALRSAVRWLVRMLQFEYHDQIRITTAVSELARCRDGGDVAAELFLRDDGSHQFLVIEVAPGTIAACEGAIAAQRLLERVDGPPGAERSVFRVGKQLPARVAAVTGMRAAQIRKMLEGELERRRAFQEKSYGEELRRQTQELSSTLVELEQKQLALTTLNAELNDTNRGVMALYAELDERATRLRRADELKTRFYSNMSHEFRTPLNSILALSRLLLDGADGQLAAEQRKQVRLIHDTASELLEGVSDLLDLAKVEAGGVTLNVARFAVGPLFGALRGMIRPLLASADVELTLGTAPALPQLVTDEGKISQILRNFLSNAVKFTERGEIRLTAVALNAGAAHPRGGGTLMRESLLFCVADTGIGIAADDQEAIFREFSQVKHSLQRRVRGTGLGLPLCRQLASLLEGEVWVESEVGRGSSFFLLVPRVHQQAAAEALAERAGETATVLVLSDRAEQRAALEDLFADGPFSPASARPAEVTAALLAGLAPAIVVVDSTLEGAAAESVGRAGIPVLSVPAMSARAARLDEAAPGGVVRAACRMLLRDKLSRVLVIDDDENFRMILGKDLESLCGQIVSTGDPMAALSAAKGGGIDCAVVDLLMPELDGFQLLRCLREDSVTERLPILVCSSKVLSAEERALLRNMHAAFVSKSRLSLASLEQALLEARLKAPSAWADAQTGRVS